jgi:hypothetical protein
MRKSKITEIFGSFLEVAALAGLLIHFLVVILIWLLLNGSFTGIDSFPDTAEAIGKRGDPLLLFGISLLLYGGLTWLGYFPQKFIYPWKLKPENAANQFKLARAF